MKWARLEAFAFKTAYIADENLAETGGPKPLTFKRVTFAQENGREVATVETATVKSDLSKKDITRVCKLVEIDGNWYVVRGSLITKK